MSEAKSKGEPKTVHVLMSGKHTRTGPDGELIRYRPGDLVPDLTSAELLVSGDKFLSPEGFAERVAGHNQALQADVAPGRAGT